MPSSVFARSTPRCAESKKDLSPSVPLMTSATFSFLPVYGPDATAEPPAATVPVTAVVAALTLGAALVAAPVTVVAMLLTAVAFAVAAAATVGAAPEAALRAVLAAALTVGAALVAAPLAVVAAAF